MEQIARGFLVYDLTRSAKILGLVSAAGAVPALGLALVGGAVADRMARKPLIQAAQWITAASALFIAVSLTTDTLTWFHLLGAGMVSGAAMSFMVPARQAMIPDLVGRERFGNAIALIAMAMSATSLVAPAIGGVLYAAIGPEGVYYVITASGLAAVFLTNSIQGAAREARSARPAMLAEIKDGLRHVWRHKLVRVLLGISLATGLLAGPFYLLLPVLVVDVYHRESGAFGLLVSFAGAGTVAGSLLVGLLGEGRRGLLVIVASFTGGIAMLLVAAIPVYLVAAAIMVPFGLGLGGRGVLNQVLIMEQVGEEYRGRVMSIMLIIMSLVPLGVLPAGLMVDLVGIRWTVGAFGLGLLVTGFLVLISQKQVRTLE